MANTSYDLSLQIRLKALEDLSDIELNDRVALDIVKEINSQRRNNGISGLLIDEYCVSAAADSFQNIGSLQSLVTSHNVVGMDYLQILHEKQFSISPSMSPNQALYEGFFSLLSTLDLGQKNKIFDSGFTHIGLVAKRSFGFYKLMIILFKKQIAIHHVSLDPTSGIKIVGKMIDSHSAIFAAVIKDNKESSKPAIAGPKRIILKPDLKEFEICVPRILLTQRSVTEKLLEFYIIKSDPRSIGYNSGQDLTSIPTESILCHKMSFTGL